MSTLTCPTEPFAAIKVKITPLCPVWCTGKHYDYTDIDGSRSRSHYGHPAELALFDAFGRFRLRFTLLRVDFDGVTGDAVTEADVRVSDGWVRLFENPVCAVTARTIAALMMRVADDLDGVR